MSNEQIINAAIAKYVIEKGGFEFYASRVDRAATKFTREGYIILFRKKTKEKLVAYQIDELGLSAEEANSLPKAKLGDPTEKGMSAIHAMNGVQDLLEVFDDRVTITPKGVLGFLNKGIQGTKEIPFSSIVAVQFKEAGAIMSGYLQFTIPGGNESRGGLLAATKDENTFMFAHTKNNALAREIKEYINEAVRKSRTPQTTAPSISLSDELEKLARLKEQGVLSEEEFQAAKRRLIG